MGTYQGNSGKREDGWKREDGRGNTRIRDRGKMDCWEADGKKGSDETEIDGKQEETVGNISVRPKTARGNIPIRARGKMDWWETDGKKGKRRGGNRRETVGNISTRPKTAVAVARVAPVGCSSRRCPTRWHTMWPLARVAAVVEVAPAPGRTNRTAAALPRSLGASATGRRSRSRRTCHHLKRTRLWLSVNNAANTMNL